MLCYEMCMLCDEKFEQHVWWYAMLCYGMLWDMNKIAIVHRRVLTFQRRMVRRQNLSHICNVNVYSLKYNLYKSS